MTSVHTSTKASLQCILDRNSVDYKAENLYNCSMIMHSLDRWQGRAGQGRAGQGGCRVGFDGNTGA